jgi:hypothetical protein
MCFSTQLNVPFSPLKTLIGMQFSFQKRTQFSQGINVQDAPAANTCGFLSREECFSTNQLNRAIWNKMSLSPPLKT